MTKEELKQEAREYARPWKTSLAYVSVKDAYFAGAESREKRIAELEKENAELKEKLKPENCLKLLAKEGYVKFTSDQLTKAKEIIKYLLSFIQKENYKTRWDINITEAEQFLNSEVEK